MTFQTESKRPSAPPCEESERPNKVPRKECEPAEECCDFSTHNEAPKAEKPESCNDAPNCEEANVCPPTTCNEPDFSTRNEAPKVEEPESCNDAPNCEEPETCNPPTATCRDGPAADAEPRDSPCPPAEQSATPRPINNYDMDAMRAFGDVIKSIKPDEMLYVRSIRKKEKSPRVVDFCFWCEESRYYCAEVANYGTVSRDCKDPCDFEDIMRRMEEYHIMCVRECQRDGGFGRYCYCPCNWMKDDFEHYTSSTEQEYYAKCMNSLMYPC